jgi:hypothetical protein
MDGLLESSGISQSMLRREARAAFDMWEQAANIRFHEIADVATAGIVIGAQEHPDGRAFADVMPRPDHSGQIEKALICLNPHQPWKAGFDGNLAVYDLRYTIAHEIGHAIGLDHPGPSGQVMSYGYHEEFRTLQAGDIDGAMALYGSLRAKEPMMSAAGRALAINPSSSRASAVKPTTLQAIYARTRLLLEAPIRRAAALAEEVLQ